MSHPTATWSVTIPEVVNPVAAPDPVAPSQPASGLQSQLGRGVIHPFRRDKKGDFASAVGKDAVTAGVTQILGTIARSQVASGEVPWRGEFGSLAHLLVHGQNTPEIVELANHYVVDALARWEPRAQVKQTDIQRPADSPNVVIIAVRFDFIDINTGAAIFQDLETSIQIP